MQRPPRATRASLPGLANGQGRHAVGAALRPNLLLPGRPRPSSPPVRPTLSPTRDTDCGVRSALPSRVQLQDVDPPPASPAKGPHVHAPAPPAAASAETPLTATPLRAAPLGPGGERPSPAPDTPRCHLGAPSDLQKGGPGPTCQSPAGPFLLSLCSPMGRVQASLLLHRGSAGGHAPQAGKLRLKGRPRRGPVVGVGLGLLGAGSHGRGLRSPPSHRVPESTAPPLQ